MWAYVLALIVGSAQFIQSGTGELHVSVLDPGGLPVQCRVTLVSEANDVFRQLDTGDDGRFRLTIAHAGFAPYEALINIDSVLPVEYTATLTPATLQTQITVRAEDT